MWWDVNDLWNTEKTVTVIFRVLFDIDKLLFPDFKCSPLKSKQFFVRPFHIVCISHIVCSFVSCFSTGVLPWVISNLWETVDQQLLNHGFCASYAFNIKIFFFFHSLLIDDWMCVDCKASWLYHCLPFLWYFQPALSWYSTISLCM